MTLKKFNLPLMVSLLALLEGLVIYLNMVVHPDNQPGLTIVIVILFAIASGLISMVLFAVNIRKTRNTAQRRFAAVILGSFVFISLPVIIAFAAKAAGNATLLKAVESIMCKAAGVLAVAVTYVAFHMQQVPAPTPGFFADHSSR